MVSQQSAWRRTREDSVSLVLCLLLLWHPLADDLRLNSLVFQWPEQILVELENSKLRLAAMREKSEGCLTTRSLSCH